MRAIIRTLPMLLLASCAPPDGLLAPGPWGNGEWLLDVATDGSAVLQGGCLYATVDAATVEGGAFDWVLSGSGEGDTGATSETMGFAGTINADTMEATLSVGASSHAMTLTRGVDREAWNCD